MREFTKPVRVTGLKQEPPKYAALSSDDKLMTVRECAEYLTQTEGCLIKEQTIRVLMCKGLFPYQKIGTGVVISLKKLRRWTDELNSIYKEAAEQGKKPTANDARREALRRITANLNKARIN